MSPALTHCGIIVTAFSYPLLHSGLSVFGQFLPEAVGLLRASFS